MNTTIQTIKEDFIDSAVAYLNDNNHGFILTDKDIDDFKEAMTKDLNSDDINLTTPSEFINNLWHNPEECPELEREIIFENSYFHKRYLGGEWKPEYDDFERPMRWCYVADIRPRSNEINRPYSNVDYAHGEAAGASLMKKQIINTLFKILNEKTELNQASVEEIIDIVSEEEI